MDSTQDSPKRRTPDRRLIVNVADLRRRLGERRVIDIDVLLPPMEVIASRSVDEPVLGTLTIESIERGVTVSGQLSFEWSGDCRRCLELVEGRNTVDVMEIFQVNAPGDVDEISELVADTIDLVPVVRDAVLLGLPLAPLCREDCVGPDPERFPTITEDDLSQREKPPDPRWAGLAALELPEAENN